MKFLGNIPKRLLCAMLSILLISVISIPAFADGWIPSSAIYDKKILRLLDTTNGRKAMNLFLSNFSEANVDQYGSVESVPSMYKVDFLYKHFELNASLYGDVVIENNGNSIIMIIPQATFEKTAKKLLGLEITPEYDNPADGKGYENGYFHVTANQVNSPKKVLSIASKIEYYGYPGKELYTVNFAIYKAVSIKDSFYSFSSKEAANNPSLKRIGDGTADFIYIGGTGSSAFELSGYSLKQFDKSELLYTEANEPVKAGVATTATSEESTISPSVITTAKDKTDKSDTAGQSNTRALILLTVAVVLVAVAATVLIVKVYKKKE